MTGSRFAHCNWGSCPRFVGLAALILTAGVGRLALAVPPPAPTVPGWADVDRLVSEQKYEAAATEVAELRERARKAGDDAGWAKALIRETQLRIGLHGPEAAVRFLQDQPWPKDRLGRAALLLYRAHAYVTYNQEYAWEIGQRERLSGTSSDLKTWTSEQIFGAATASYAELWKTREALGAEPIARLADYLDANNYPPEVRGTLRDALSYMFIELLGNTQGWSAAQSEDVFQLDLAALLKGDVTRSRNVNLADPAVHPLLRIAAVLDDLEAWHLARRERDAALETRLTRAKLLFAHFTADADRARIVKDLDGRLAAFRDRPWWAMGNGVLAQLEEQLGHRLRTHTLAAAGAAAYPRTPGGQLCRSIAARLEAPDYQLAAMEADGRHQRSLLVTHSNLPSLTLRAYPIDLERRLLQGGDFSDIPLWQPATRPSWDATRERVDGVAAPHPRLQAAPDVRDTAAGRAGGLPDRRLGPTGLRGGRQRHRGPDLHRHGPGDALPVARGCQRGARGRRRHWKPRSERDRRGLSDRLRRASQDRRGDPPDGRRRHGRGFHSARDREGSYQFVARHGGSLALDGLPPRYGRLGQTKEAIRALVYTDRSIYRPEQKLSFKAIVFTGQSETARFHVIAGREVTVSLKESERRRGGDTQAEDERVRLRGRRVQHPGRPPAGTWEVNTTANGSAEVRVEEYKRRTFEVKLLDSQTPARLNKRADLDGEARYFFGLPVTAGQVRWRVTREPVYPFWWGWRWLAPSAAPRTVATGTAKLDPEAASTWPSRRAPTNATARRCRTGTGLQPTSPKRAARPAAPIARSGWASPASKRIWSWTPASSAPEWPPRLKATRANLDGIPRSGQATWALAELVQPKTPLLPSEQPPSRNAPKLPGDVETPGDRLTPRWEAGDTSEQALFGWTADRPAVTAGTVVHDEKGEARIALPILAPGAYRVEYESRDDFGAIYKSQKDFVVAGGDSTPAVSVPAMLALEKATVAAGGTARVLATSGFPRSVSGMGRLARWKAAAPSPPDRGQGRTGPRRSRARRRSRRPGDHVERRTRSPALLGDGHPRRSVGRQTPGRLAVHLSRSDSSGREGDLDHLGQRAAGGEGRGSPRRAAGVHVRSQPRSLRASPTAQPDVAVAVAGHGADDARDPGTSPGALARLGQLGAGTLRAAALRRSVEAGPWLRDRWSRRAGLRRGWAGKHGSRQADVPGTAVARRPHAEGTGHGHAVRGITQQRARAVAAGKRTATRADPAALRLLRDRVLAAAIPDRR